MLSDKEKFENLYKDVENNVSRTLSDVSQISLKSEKGNQHLTNIKLRLEDIQKQFNSEITFLKNNAEWEKFTIAFFGETNAGKSTVIDALRIIFDEKSRQKQIQENIITLPELEKSFSAKSDELLKLLEQSMENYDKEVRHISDQMEKLKEDNIKEYGFSNKILRYGLAVFLGLMVGILSSYQFFHMT